MRVVPCHPTNLPYRMDELFEALHNYCVLFLLSVYLCYLTQQIVFGYSLEIGERVVDRHHCLIGEGTDDDESVSNALNRESLGVLKQDFCNKLCNFLINFCVNGKAVEIPLYEQAYYPQLFLKHFIISLDLGQAENADDEGFVLGDVVLLGSHVFVGDFVGEVPPGFDELVENAEDNVQEFVGDVMVG